ncbi:secondary thiamine-phosphate synthase enzyme YjbQ [Halococcus sp. PRR34]|uniref:secondary thiamine-phosphate synthase enzyme YjbQ n=1 Tax=Halococcus sp. PRR34 TaxID=3020830 RepID=UPI002362B530|nr:secondary thiamine-phosphate synthase enzyme YjbQ [Halococcus sp. PRR34]
MAIEVSTTERIDIVDITSEVAEAVPADIDDGMCLVFVQHTTAGVVLNENERGLLNDITRAVESLVPADEDYEHDAIDDNAVAHLQATVLGESVTVPVVEGELDLGRWQSVLFVECDGPQTRRVSVTVIDG